MHGSFLKWPAKNQSSGVIGVSARRYPRPHGPPVGSNSLTRCSNCMFPLPIRGVRLCDRVMSHAGPKQSSGRPSANARTASGS